MLRKNIIHNNWSWYNATGINKITSTRIARWKYNCFKHIKVNEIGNKTINKNSHRWNYWLIKQITDNGKIKK